MLTLCPINAFWWPVKADVQKAVAHTLTGAHKDAHYASLYFHADGPEVAAELLNYFVPAAEHLRNDDQLGFVQ